jgi:DNA-binding NtrC family response regulator
MALAPGIGGTTAVSWSGVKTSDATVRLRTSRPYDRQALAGLSDRMHHPVSGPTRILVADDQRDVVEALRLLLKSEGYQMDAAGSPVGVLKAVERREYDIVLIDLNYARDTTSGEEGLDLLARLHAIDDTLPVVVMTAWASVGLAVEAMRRGARDFVEKPWSNERMLAILRTQAELGRVLRRTTLLEAQNRLQNERCHQLIASSAAMRPVLDLIARVGPSEANVLITGENGTGKGVVAQALHAASARSNRPIVTLNAGGVSEGVFESELFGHVKGAFTDARHDRIGRFEMADGGTLFLDEIANVPLSQQQKLLRVLERGEFERLGSSMTRKADVRLVSATNADIDAEVEAGRFRQDLLFRLNTVEIRLPPLRDRSDDIPVLANHFLTAHARRYRKNLAGFDDVALRALSDYAWPGNVRELDHTVERAVLMARGARIHVADLVLRSRREAPIRLDDMSLEEVEAFLIKKALARHGTVAHAARALGLSRSALYRRLERYGLE